MKKSTLSWFAAAGLLLASSAFALERTAALGAGGEIYLAKSGTYRDLFPNGSETNPDNPVLAIDVVKSGSATQRLLVPFTREAEPESSPALIYEDNSSTLFLVWESRLNLIHSVLMLASFDGERWSNPIQITGNPFSSKSSPQLAVTRDTYSIAHADGTVETRRRTFLHMMWEEEAGSGEFELLYTPVILEEGRYLGWNPIYRLNDMVADGDSGSSFAPSSALLQTPTLQSGRDPRTVVVGFAASAGRWMTGLVIDVLPAELSQLAEKMRSSIIDIGHQGSFPGNRPGLAEKARADLIARGTAFHSDVIHYMADQIHAQILADRGDDLEGLASKMRSSIIDIGARLSGRGLRDGAAKASLQEIDPLETGPAAPPPHLIHFRAVTNRPTPQAGNKGLRVFVSEEAEEMIVAWADQDKLFYRITKDDGWSDEREIKLSDSVSLESAYELLAQRVRGH
jgi:hypothetical protein